MTLFRRLFRLARLLMHLANGLWQASAMFPFYSPARRDRAISAWSATLLDVLGVRRDSATPPHLDHGALLVANHISWLDIFVILATRRVHFVSKHEVRGWPVLGWLAERAGTLFIRRAKKHDTARVGAEMHGLLQQGAWVAVFPEGTSTDGRRLLRFLPSLFQPAVSEALPVVPAAIRYQRPGGDYTDVPAYIDDMPFHVSLWRILGEREIVAKLHFCAPLRLPDRRLLAQAAHREVATCLGLDAADNSPETPAGLPAAAR
jgi:1-acyl-sn-glycerol-3-phosphate acyltransferase